MVSLHTFPHRNPVYASPLPIRATCHEFHSSRFDNRTISGEEYRPFFWQGQEIYLFSRASRPAMKVIQSPFQRRLGVFTPGIERPGRGVNHSLPSCTEVTNERCCKSTHLPPPPYLIGVHENKLIFQFHVAALEGQDLQAKVAGQRRTL